MNRKLWLFLVCAVLTLTLCLGNDCFSRGSSSSSSRSSSGGYSSSRSSGGGSWGGSSSKSSGGWGGSSSKSSGGWGGSSSKSSGGWGGSSSKSTTSPSTSTSSGGWSWGGASKKSDSKSTGIGASGRNATKTPAKQMSAADKAMYDKAKISGTAFKSRDDAIKSFQAKNASKYSTSFKTEPSKRPDYIPNTTVVGGRSYTVIYDPLRGGYGYYDGGTWYAYNVMRDMVMLNALMHRNNYYYGPQPVAESSSGVGTFLFILFLLAICGVIAVAWLGVGRRRGY